MMNKYVAIEISPPRLCVEEIDVGGGGKEELSCVKWQSTYQMKFCLIQK